MGVTRQVTMIGGPAAGYTSTYIGPRLPPCLVMQGIYNGVFSRNDYRHQPGTNVYHYVRSY